MTLDERLVQVTPSPRQLAHQQLEFYAFIHFTVNAFTDREWGDGTEDPAIFNPEKLDAEQWAAAVKSAGMRGIILTCKHHDGFCLWPSKFTEHSVASSPYRGGHGDIVREVSDACRRNGLKFGVYLSPWDRNCPLYGQGEAYDDYFVGQLTELLTNYGEIFSVWFDGACGEGPNGKRQVYDWDRYDRVIRDLQPGACISVCGPDVRWCGNEAGYTRPAEWSVVPRRMWNTEKIAAKSQQSDDASFRLRRISASDNDLGSREILKNEPDLIWYAAEVNTSIRPGWFWHASENDRVRPLDELLRIYYNSVGGNATFLLNIPPTNEGLFHENDVERLREIGEALRKAFAVNLTADASLTADTAEACCEIDGAREDRYETFWRAAAGKNTAEITARWEKPVSVGNLVMKENILLSQRIEAFAVDVLEDGEFREVCSGTVVGYKRIVRLGGIQTTAVRVRILDSRTEPTLAFFAVYEG
ncbi:MAG: alpha-L-fucosidase [Clostridia bacterium]|nr:alpha-L-fucosidase [Clostridia bacterium]